MNKSEKLISAMASVMGEKDLVYALGLLEMARMAHQKSVQPFIDELERFLNEKKTSIKEMEELDK